MTDIPVSDERSQVPVGEDDGPVSSLTAALAAQLDDARPQAVARVHGGGKLTARERLTALLDEGTAVSFGTIAAQSAEGEWIAEAGGVDFVGSIEGQTVIASSTDYTDHGGGYGAGRIPRLFALAHEHRWPIVFFVDGGGSRARHPRAGLGHIEINGPIGPFTLFDGISQLSGWVPTIAIVSGPAFAGHASLAGFSDVVIATGGSSIGMGGPPMVEAALGKRLTPNELAGVEMHDVTGGVDFLVADETEAIAVARRYLAFTRALPAGSGIKPADSAARIGELVPVEGAYDVRLVIEALADAGSVLEIRPSFAASLVTTLARFDGRSVGILANQPAVLDGAIDGNAATKIARFVELCDCYEFPIVSLVDTPGCVSRWPSDPSGKAVHSAGAEFSTEPGITRWHARPLMAHHHRSVPLFSVQLRRGGGLGPALMGAGTSGRSTPALTLAWPGVRLGQPDGYAVVYNHNTFDDVVAPSETRERIIRMLSHLATSAMAPAQLRARTEKKHPIDTW